MEDKYIKGFMQLSPEHFPYVLKHDWWNRYPTDDVDLRSELDLLLSSEPKTEGMEILKLKCFYVQPPSQTWLFPRFERPLRLGVKSIQERQWEGYVYCFVEADTGEELFACRSFEAQITSVI